MKKAKHHQRKHSIKCLVCKKKIIRCKGHCKKHTFCSVDCYHKWQKKHQKEINKNNRMNQKGGWKLEERIKLRETQLERCKCKNKAYKKYLGRHIHRVIAEMILGRKLKKGEIVHHIDGNKLNNSPKNLMVLKSQAEHCKLHFTKKGVKKNEIIPTSSRGTRAHKK